MGSGLIQGEIVIVNNRHVAALHSLSWQFSPFTKAFRRLETYSYISCFRIVTRLFYQYIVKQYVI